MPQLSQVLSSRQRVTSIFFQRLYPPPAFVTITWYRPFDSNCSSGIGESGLLKTRIGVSIPPEVLRKSDISAACEKNAVAFGMRSWSSSMVAGTTDPTEWPCIGRSRSKTRCQEADALVVCHERPDHGARLTAGLARRRVVDGFIEAVSSLKPAVGESLQIEARLLGHHHQRQCRRVRCDDQILGQPSSEPQAGYAKRAVLIVEMDVNRIVAGFRNAPGTPRVLPYSICLSTTALQVWSSSVFS